MALQDRSSEIDHDAPVHVWRQLAALIRADIESGELGPNARLPSEPELAAQFGVARVTVRTAVAELVSDGLVVIVRGRGTYVTPSGQRSV